jgi:hypothetical protein
MLAGPLKVDEVIVPASLAETVTPVEFPRVVRPRGVKPERLAQGVRVGNFDRQDTRANSLPLKSGKNHEILQKNMVVSIYGADGADRFTCEFNDAEPSALELERKAFPLRPFVPGPEEAHSQSFVRGAIQTVKEPMVCGDSRAEAQLHPWST